MDTKQILAIAAVLALVGAGVVGVAYAYTATTSNSGNALDTAYLELSQSGMTGDFDNVAYWDTKQIASGDDAGKIQYWMNVSSANNSTNLSGNTDKTVGDETYDLFKLGTKEIALKSSALYPSAYTFSITPATGHTLNQYVMGTDEAIYVVGISISAQASQVQIGTGEAADYTANTELFQVLPYNAAATFTVTTGASAALNCTITVNLYTVQVYEEITTEGNDGVILTPVQAGTAGPAYGSGVQLDFKAEVTSLPTRAA